jgi:tetratricopeptide (TPR) repeat protein
MSALLLIPEVARRGADPAGQPDWGLATVIYMLISLTIGLVFGLVLANRQVSFLAAPTTMDELIAISDRIAGLQTLYYGFLLFAMVAGAVSLMLGLRQVPKRTAHPWGAISTLVLGVAATAIIVPFNLRPIQADIIYKQADPYDRQGQWTISRKQYEHALELAPKEDFYKLYLGRALLELATVVQDAGAQQDVLRETEAVLVEARKTNPLNTDHSANLARMYRRWAGLTTDETARQGLLDLSMRNYEIATTLSPSNALLWNEWSLLHYWDLRDVDGYERVHERSLAIDPEYEQTWLICGDISRDQGKLEEAIRCYEEALRLKPDQAQVWRVLADTYIAQEDWESAIDALSTVVELQPADRTPDIWNVHHVLSQLYLQMGDRDRALQAAIRAVQLVPQNQITVVQNWLAQLQSMEAPQE